MEINPNFVLEDCPICRGSGFMVRVSRFELEAS